MKNLYGNIVKAFLVAGAAFAVAGCCPRRLSVSQSTADSLFMEREVQYVERIRDTVIYVSVPVEVKQSDAQRDSSFLETSVAKSVARVNGDGSLFHTLENKPLKEPVRIKVKDTSRQETASVGSIRIERVEIPVPSPLTWIQKTLMGCGTAFVSIVVASAIFFLLRSFFRRRR